MSNHAGRAFAVHWSELPQWDPLTASLAARFKTSYPLVPLGEVATVRWELATKAQLDSGEVKMVERVSFDGEIFAGGKDSTKMEQWVARPGDLLISKIRARQGSVGLVSESHGLVSGSIHYRSLTPDATKVDAVYAWLALRSDYCRAQFLAATGGAMKGEISEERLLALKIPLPALTTQQAIVDHWNATQKRNAAALRAADEHEAEVEANFLNSLGLKQAALPSIQRGFALRWTDIQRWGVDGLRKTIGGIDPSKGKFAAQPLGTMLEFAQYGTSDKANELEKGIPVLRIGNIKEGRISWDNLKHIELAPKTEASLMLVDGDILIIRTSGSRDLVGTCGVYRGDRPAVFASYLIRLRVDQTKAVPEFISYFVNSPAGRQQVDAVSRQIMQNNINSEEIKGLRIPLPPISIQKQLVAKVISARAKIAAERAAAAKLAADTTWEVEQMILGVFPVPLTKH